MEMRGKESGESRGAVCGATWPLFVCRVSKQTRVACRVCGFGERALLIGPAGHRNT